MDACLKTNIQFTIIQIMLTVKLRSFGGSGLLLARYLFAARAKRPGFGSSGWSILVCADMAMFTISAAL